MRGGSVPDVLGDGDINGVVVVELIERKEIGAESVESFLGSGDVSG